MKLKSLYIFPGLAAVLLIGYAVAGSYQVPSESFEVKGPERTAPHSASEAASLIIAQAYSTRCATSRGTCTLPTPQEVGTRCYCDGKGTGKVVR